jgi:hypothetical protein
MGGMAPPQVIISQPQPDNSNNSSNSLLSSFITSKLLNESMNLNRTNMTNVEQPTTREQPSYFNARESIIPRLPDTPLKQEVQPPTGKGPPKPPPPPPPPKPPPPPPKGIDLSDKIGVDNRYAMIEEIKYAQTEEGKAEKARKRAEAAAKREAKKFEKETAPNPDKAATKLQKVIRGKLTRNNISNEIGQMETKLSEIEKQVKKKKASQAQSTTDFLNMTFTPPKKDIVEMLTPQKERKSTALTPYKGQQSTLDFLIGGTPQKTPQQLRVEKQINRLKEIKRSPKIKDIFESNDLKTEMTNQPNPNKAIASSIINRAIKSNIARKELTEKKIDQSIKNQKQREEASHRLQAAMKTKLTKSLKEAKKEHKPQNTGEPLVVNQNTKQLILKKNRDRGIKAQQAAASKKRSSEQEKIIKFAKFMIDQNGVQPFQGLKQTEI